MSNRDAKRAKRLDRPAAKGYYVALRPSERTYAAVARKFGVSDVTVRKWAHRDGWPEAAAEADRKATERAVAVGTRSREEFAAQTARIRAKVGDRIEARLDAEAFDDALAVRLYEATDKAFRLDRNEATENVEFRVVQPVIVGLVTRMHRVVVMEATVEQRTRAFEAEVDWLEGELLAIEAPGDGS